MQFALVLYGISFCVYKRQVQPAILFSHVSAEKLALSCQRKSKEDTEGEER